MAIQTKLLLTKNEVETVIFLDEGLDLNKPIFTTTEYVNTRLKFVGNAGEHVWFEHINVDAGLKLNPGVAFDLIKTNDSYVPGRFMFRFKNVKGEVKIGHFLVISHHLTKDIMTSMYTALEQRSQGITRNRHTEVLLKDESDEQDEIQKFFTLFSVHHQSLITALSNISSNPNVNLTNQYQLTPVSKKPTEKSFKWQANVGQRKINPGFYEPRKQLDYDTTENQLLKAMLLTLKQKLTAVQMMIDDIMLRHTTLKSELDKEKVALVVAKKKIRQEQNFKVLNYDLNKRLALSNETLATLNEDIKKDLITFAPIKLLLAALTALMNETWFKQVSTRRHVKLTKKIFGMKYYQSLALFYQQYMIGQGDFLRYPRNHTSKLFEYFSLFLVEDILIHHGFKPKIDDEQLPMDDRILFENALGARIYLSFDRLIGDLTLAKQENKAQLVSIVGGSRRPDLLLELHDAKGDFVTAFILEVKYRRLKNIYREDKNTDVMNQLNVYSTFKYFMPEKAFRQMADVSQIVVMYPTAEDEQVTKDVTTGYEFMPIVPTGFDLSAPTISPLVSLIKTFLQNQL